MSAQRACSLDELPEVGAVRVVLDGVPVAVVRDEDGEVHAVSDTCSHAEVSLSEGEVDDSTIECWLHGSRFDLRTGEPTALPASGRSPSTP
jgi:3-phenylpropionate/trans-cinnamate dioxygenase ferredoxin subunit